LPKKEKHENLFNFTVASEDLDKIFDYFASNNVEAGEKFVIDFEKKM